MVRDPTRPPHGQLPVADPGPQAWEPVTQLQCPTQIAHARVGGHAQRGGVLHRRELRHQRCTHTSQRDRPVTEEPMMGVVHVGPDLVQHRPLDRRLKDPDLRRITISPMTTQPRQHHSSSAARGLGCGVGHRTIQALATDTERSTFALLHRGLDTLAALATRPPNPGSRYARSARYSTTEPWPPRATRPPTWARYARCADSTTETRPARATRPPILQTSTDNAGARSPRGSMTTVSRPSQSARRHSSTASSSAVSPGAPGSA